MAGINIRKFLGIAPKIASELIPDTVAQVARNTKLFSGDLIPQAESLVVGHSGRHSGTKTLYGIPDPDTGDLVWLTWDKIVDIAIVTTEEGGEFRFFYTGDGAPKYSTFDLATSGPAPHPGTAYSMGLPLPKTKPTTTKVPFVDVAVATYGRDANAVIVLNTAVPHLLKDKAVITLTGFNYLEGTYTVSGTTVTHTIPNHGLTGTPTLPLTMTSGNAVSGTYQASIVDANTFTTIDPSTPTTGGVVRLGLGSFNATSVIATRFDADTVSFQSSGFEKALSADQPAAKIKLGGSDIPRTYVYTWYTEWEEESIASEPSTTIYVKEGDTVIVGNLPSTFPDPSNYSVQGIRLYRSGGSATAADYLLLKTLWWPKPVISYSRTAGVATVEFATAHFMIDDDRFKITGMADASFDVANGIVVTTTDDNHMSYASAGPDVARTATGAGIIYYDVAESAAVPPRYWGYAGNYDFTDDFDSLNLETVLESDNYEAPPEGLEGLITAQNGMLAGFVRNTVYFSLPYKPNAWPSEFAITLDYDVVALALLSGTVVVLTVGYPFLISGNEPAALGWRRLDALYPCIARGSVVSMNYGIVYSTHDGLAVISTQLSAQLASKVLFNNETWHAHLDPHDIVADFYGDAYVASWPGGSFTFEPVGGEQAPPYFVDFIPKFSAPWYDPIAGALYYAQIDNDGVYEWDPLTGAPLPQAWKSKTFKTPDMINLGAVRVIADFPTAGPFTPEELVDLGWVKFPWSRAVVTPDVYLTLWANKTLITTIQVGHDGIFRLPTGYRADTFEVAVASNIRVRAIHLSETPYELRKV